MDIGNLSVAQAWIIYTNVPCGILFLTNET